MDTSLTEYQLHLIKVLRYVTEFCDNNGIQYFVAYGTLLGAVRHNGIIPWDDDADIFVPRADYERLIRMRGSLQNDGYDLLSMESENSYITYAKIYDKSTTLWEVKQFPQIIGVFVDVFPLDYADSPIEDVVADVKSFSVVSKQFSLANSDYTIRDAFLFLKGFHLKTAWAVVRSLFLKRKRSLYYNKLYRFYKQLEKQKGEYLVDYSSASNVENPRGVIYRSAWFDDFALMPFCGFKVKVPIGFDYYLRCRYGDYMSLPPVSERVPQHSHFFLDLNKSWTKEALLQEMTKDQ